MAAETFRRTKLIRWVKLQIQITEQLMRTNADKNYTQAKSDMIESIRKEFGIEYDELGEF